MSEHLGVGHTKRMPGLVCPECGGAADGATSVNDGKAVTVAKPGDFAMCAYCGVMLRYMESPAARSGLVFRAMSPDEWAAIRRDPRLKKLSDAMAKVRGNLKRKGLI